MIQALNKYNVFQKLKKN